MSRFVACIEYNGSGYHGWQTNKCGLPSVQTVLEQALSSVGDHPVSVVCAGRTDAGVHASGQIVHFESTALRSNYAWTMGCNSRLPRDVAVVWVAPVVDNFHARHSALWRRYRYVILNRRIRPAHLAGGVTFYHHLLDTDLMTSAAQWLIGEHDFNAYRTVQCQARHAVREVYDLTVERTGDLVVVDIRANAFLHHMVRNIVGVLLDVGTGKKPPHWVGEVLDARDRKAGGVTARPDGLYLVAVGYPQRFMLPEVSTGPFFIS